MREPLDAASGPHSVSVPLRSWWMVGVLSLFYILSVLDRIILTLLVTPIKADLSLTDFEMSLILGPAFAVFYALFGFPLGWAADRRERRWIIACGVTLWSIMTVASGFARSFTSLLLCRIGVAVGEAALSPAAYSMLADEFPKEKLTTAISIYQMAAKFGTAAAFAIGSLAIVAATQIEASGLPVVRDLQPWQLVFMMIGLPGMLATLLIYTISEPARKETRSESGEIIEADLMPFLRAHWRLITCMMIGFGAISACGYGLTSWIPTYIERTYDVPVGSYGPMLAIASVISGMSIVLNGILIDWLYGRGYKDAHLRVLLLLLAVAMPIGLFMFHTASVTTFIILYCLVQFALVPFMVYISSIVALLAPNRLRGRMNALFLAVTVTIGLGAGPMLIGAITDFVYGDESRIGSSLEITLIGGLVLALVTLFAAKRELHKTLI